jgi:hypothetical protein
MDQIYLAEHDVSNNDRRSVSHAYVKESIATYYLRHEPWTIAFVRPLCLVHSYRKVIFGEGAKSLHALESTSQVTVNSAKNFWYCEENSTKLHAEGAVANLLFHMNLQEDAEEFHKLSTMSGGELLNAMAANKPPKNVQDH